MSRPLRIEFPGAIYHIITRGNARLPIFEDDRDRKEFLTILEKLVERFNCLCHAYCLMDNHYHLLIETMEANLSRAMRHLNGVYTQWFNHRHNRVGHIFQGRYKAILVQRENYLLELCRYVVLNPIRAGMVKEIGEYVWSSYQATAGLSDRPSCLTVDWILSQFAGKRHEAHQLYKQFVDEGMKTPGPWEVFKTQPIIGDRGFIESVKPALKNKCKIKEIAKPDRLVFRPTLEELFKEEKERIKGEERNMIIVAAHLRHGYTLSEIGKYLGLHYTTVSKILKRGCLTDPGSGCSGDIKN